jgi:Replication-relaxation
VVAGVIAWRPIAVLSSLLSLPALLVVAAGSATGDLGGLWVQIRTPVAVLGVMVSALVVVAVFTVVGRVRARRLREMTRFQLTLGQSDEATHDETAAACEHLVQVLRCTLTARVCGGQPWLAIESWHMPSSRGGETGSATLMLLCEPVMLDPAVAALRRAFPNLGVRRDPRSGEPCRYGELRFAAAHVLRVRKARDWALPIGGPKGRPDTSNARSVMAAVIRQQQEVGRKGFVSCVRWCLLPAAESVDSDAANRLRRMADSTRTANAAVSADILEAQRGGGGAMCFVELQAAVEPTRTGPDRRRFADLQAVCRLLLSPALSQRGVNTLVERQMILRQDLYRRRWARGTPPLLPDQSGATLLFATELAVMLEFPGLGAEHGLPLQRSTVPYLPAPPGLTRAQMLQMPVPTPAPTGTEAQVRTMAAGDQHSACADAGPASAGVPDGDASDAQALRCQNPDRMLKIAVAAPDVPWSIAQRDRKYGLQIAAGQGSGKSSLLIRYAMGDLLAANTATIVFDMKGSLAERLLRLTPPDIPKRYFDHDSGVWRDGVKRVWYLDLGAPAFGLTPLHVEPGWSLQTLPDAFVRIAGLVVHSLLDLFPGQIFQSSEDIIERAVIGTMAIAWFEHDERHRRDASDPTAQGFSGSFEVLAKMFAPTDRHADGEQRNRRVPPPNRWHEAAGRACQRIDGLAHMADQLLYEIPGQVRANLHGMEQRMAAPANKLGPLVYSHAAVRRFVEHPKRLSLQSVLESHDILIVNPRKDVLGDGSQPEILTNFIVHMINAQLHRQISYPQPTRPRVSLVIDEAHTLITETLMRMVSSHREAGLSVACATQYQSQIGAAIQDSAKRAYVRDGWSNLFQTKVIGRASDPADAEYYAGVLRPVYESMTRGDPTSQARIPADASNIMALEDYHFLLRAISSGQAGADGGALHAATTASGGSTALAVCTVHAEPMPEIHEIPAHWSEVHLRRMHDVFGPILPARDADDAPRDVPVGLGGATRSPTPTRAHDDASDVAAQTVGAHHDTGADAAPATEWASVRRESARGADAPAPTPTGADTVLIGGARIERSAARDQRARPDRVALFDWALRPPRAPAPPGDLAPFNQTLADAVAYAASIEQITILGPWTTIADGVLAQAAEAERSARTQARLQAAAAGCEPAIVERRMNTAARDARRTVFAKFSDEPWQADVDALTITDADVRALEILARLPLSTPLVLAVLLSEPLKERALRYRLSHLHELGLIATAPITVAGRRGRPAPAYAVSARGRELLRHSWAQLHGESDPPRHLRAERKLPEPGRGSIVPHDLAVQLVIGALRAYGASAVNAQWLTPEMPAGHFTVEMLHRGDDRVHLTDLTTMPGSVVSDERSDAPGIIMPDASVRLDGPLAGRARTLNLLLEIDRTARGSYNSEKFVAYDHFLAGWCMKTRRYGRELHARPVVVFVAQNPKAALRLLARADEEMAVGIGLPGQQRDSYQFHGRTHTAFTCMTWLLGGQAYALRMPPLPPGVRGRDTPLDAQAVALLPEAWWPKKPTSAARP